jgi:hypothetical protein
MNWIVNFPTVVKNVQKAIKITNMGLTIDKKKVQQI